MDAAGIAELAAAADGRDPRGAGLLFHGTAEPIAGALRPGGDGLLWTTDNPLVAQAYIPVCGLISIVHVPPNPGERVRPSKHSFWFEFAVGEMARGMPDVEWDRFGDAISWSIPADWPTYGECLAELRSRYGYAFEGGHAEIRNPLAPDGTRRIMPAEWRQDGEVFVTASHGLRLLDSSCGEGDLTDPKHNDFGLFRRAEDAGYDGVVIDDFCQSHDCGNVGHRSVGLFGKALEGRVWLSYRATHAPMSGGGGLATDEFLAWRESQPVPMPV